MGIIRCQNCGTDNLDSSRYCDECGAELTSAPGGRGVSPASSSVKDAAELHRPAPEAPPPQKSLASADSQWASDAAPVRPLQPTAADAPPPARAKLVVVGGDRASREFSLGGTEWLIGRWDPERGIFPDVDLASDDPEASVSRRHARLVYQDGHYLIEDLDSTNGTFINRGRRLTPGLRYLIRDGDEIIVGKTFLKFRLR